MYDMYPDAWMAIDGRRQPAAEDKPRRRIRKEHASVPATLGTTTVHASAAGGA